MVILSGMRSGEVAALGWTLLHFCWQGTAIALGWGAADRMAARSAMRVRYGMAVLALALMPVVALFTFLGQERQQNVVASQTGSIHTPLVGQIPVAAPAVKSGWFWMDENADRVLPWVDGIWLAGVLLLAFRALGGWWQLERLRRRAQTMVPAELSARFERVAEHLRVGRRVALLISDEVISPLAMGVWRTAIILPVSALLALEPAQLEAVLAHELAHVRRWDYLGNLLQTAVECLLFFHPAVWWISRRIRELREICCDEVAVGSCSDRVTYAEALLQLEEQRAERLQLATAFHGSGGALVQRVKQILGDGMTTEGKPMNGIRIAVATVALLALCLGPKAVRSLEAQTTRGAIAPERPASNGPAPEIVNVAVRVKIPVQEFKAQGQDVRVETPALAPVAVASPDVVVELVPPDPGSSPEGSTDYIQKMRDAGYALDLGKDLDTLIALRSVGVTPEYAKAMASVGLGTPALRDLIALKSVGVTPEYIAGLKNARIAPATFREVISEKSLGVTPEYANGIASIGLGTPTVSDLVSLKALGITGAYASELKASGISVKDLQELKSFRALGVTPEYVKAMAATGMADVSGHNLISLKAQGVTPEYIRWLKQTFPDADIHRVREAAAFHIDEAFVAKAKAHGFNNASLDKILKLKISGLLD